MVEVAEAESAPQKMHVAVFSSPGMGHIIPLLEFSKRLVTHNCFHVSFLVITTGASTAQTQVLQSSTLPPDLHIVNLPPADMSQIITEDMGILTRLCLIAQESIRGLGSILRELGRVNALVIDLFSTEAFDVCEELDVPVYSFCTPSASFLAFSLYLPTMDREVEGEFVELPHPVQVPGCNPVRTEDLLDQVRNRKIDEYKWFLFHVSRLPKAAAIFVNSWEHLEPVPLRAMRENSFFLQIPTPPVYPIGPLIRSHEPVSSENSYCLEWLDKQPLNSVLLVSLGSGGTLSCQQLTELARGLELSQHRFIWVVRRPADASASGTFFNVGGEENDPMSYLPEGFVKKIEGIGLLLPSWAPQVSVLSHPSTGGFLTHCGWNSLIEGIVHGVPMIAWPLYAEQRMNAALAVEELRVATMPVGCGRGEVAGREEIERVVRLVMEGEQGKVMRRRVEELRESGLKALETGGCFFERIFGRETTGDPNVKDRTGKLGCGG